MKKLLAIAMLAFGSVLGTQAQDGYVWWSTNITASSSATNFNLTTNRWLIGQVIVTAPTAVNVNCQFFDNNIAAWTNLQPAYTSIVAAPTSIVTYVTSTYGQIVTNTNVGITYLSVPNAASLVQLPVIMAVSAQANTVVTTPANIVTRNGLTINVSTNCSVQVLYRAWQ